MSGVTLARVWLPAAIGVAGLLLIVVSDSVGRGAGIVLIGVAALVVLANVLVRLALQSERDREREQRNRHYFSSHGRWPDDADRR
jgi:drug/metabolite transporter (DMT)-like permease